MIFLSTAASFFFVSTVKDDDKHWLSVDGIKNISAETKINQKYQCAGGVFCYKGRLHKKERERSFLTIIITKKNIPNWNGWNKIIWERINHNNNSYKFSEEPKCPGCENRSRTKHARNSQLATSAPTCKRCRKQRTRCRRILFHRKLESIDRAKTIINNLAYDIIIVQLIR